MYYNYAIGHRVIRVSNQARSYRNYPFQPTNNNTTVVYCVMGPSLSAPLRCGAASTAFIPHLTSSAPFRSITTASPQTTTPSLVQLTSSNPDPPHNY